MRNLKAPSRRDFIKQATVLGAAAMGTYTVASAFSLPANSGAGDNYTFLFQCGSITDGNRSRDMDFVKQNRNHYIC
ncbi:MAG TPA: twin-arginine translocation signal domain-containing protein [Mucilaginibacter sp.]